MGNLSRLGEKPSVVLVILCVNMKSRCNAIPLNATETVVAHEILRDSRRGRTRVELFTRERGSAAVPGRPVSSQSKFTRSIAVKRDDVQQLRE